MVGKMIMRNIIVGIFALSVAGLAVSLVQQTDNENRPSPLVEDRVDFWTRTETGCICGNTKGDLSCACCDPGLGCPCAAPLHNRCTQCGLEMFCGKMCNMTIDMSQLTSKHGAIYSPPTSGPIFCSYYLVANRDTRIKLQLYRLQGIGEYNEQSKRCNGGFLQIFDGVRALRGNSSAIHVFCGADSRFERPVTIFQDRAVAVIQYWTEVSVKSRFMLEFNFEDRNEADGQHTGGNAIPNSECDWIYRQHNCSNSEEPCEFYSPGYPGLYPNFQHCRYFFRSTDPALQIRVHFKTFDFPTEHCDTHYINIFDGPYSARTDPALQTLCGKQKTEELIFFSTGPSMVIEFISGFLPPPYNYAGFQGTVMFGNNPPDRIIGNKVEKTFCDWTFYSNTTPSASFSTPMDWYSKGTVCRFTFIPVSVSERAIVSFHSYFLESDHCNTVVEITEGKQPSRENRQIKRICGPQSKYAAVGDPKALEEYSAYPGKTMVISFTSKNGNQILGKTPEWLSGSFQFHDDRLLGTKTLNSVCDISFNDEVNKPSGIFTGSKPDYIMHQPMWRSATTTDCHYSFDSKHNKTIFITLKQATLVRPGEESNFWLCSTLCDRDGCRCVTDHNESDSPSLNDVFHILILTRSTPVVELACFCGDLTEILPVTISSTVGVTFRHHQLGQSATDAHVYDFNATYSFQEPPFACSRPTRNRPYGTLYIVSKRNISHVGNIAHHIQCDWNVEVPSKQYLSINLRLTEAERTGRTNQLNNSDECSTKNTVRLFTFAQRQKEKGIEFCHNNAVTVNSHKITIRLLATGKVFRHKIMWKEVSPSSTIRGSDKTKATGYVSRGSRTVLIIGVLLGVYSVR